MGVLLNGVHSDLGGLLHAAAEHHGIGAGSDVLHALADQGLGQQGGGGGAVASHIVGLGGNFLHQLGAHVLKGVLQLHFLGDGDAIVGDEGGAELLIQHHIAALGPQSDLYGIRQLVDAGKQGLAGVLAIDDFLSHSMSNPFFSQIKIRNQKNGINAIFIPQRPARRSAGRWCTPRRPPSLLCRCTWRR